MFKYAIAALTITASASAQLQTFTVAVTNPNGHYAQMNIVDFNSDYLIDLILVNGDLMPIEMIMGDGEIYLATDTMTQAWEAFHAGVYDGTIVPPMGANGYDWSRAIVDRALYGNADQLIPGSIEDGLRICRREGFIDAHPPILPDNCGDFMIPEECLGDSKLDSFVVVDGNGNQFMLRDKIEEHQDDVLCGLEDWEQYVMIPCVKAIYPAIDPQGPQEDWQKEWYFKEGGSWKLKKAITYPKDGSVWAMSCEVVACGIDEFWERQVRPGFPKPGLPGLPLWDTDPTNYGVDDQLFDEGYPELAECGLPGLGGYPPEFRRALEEGDRPIIPTFTPSNPTRQYGWDLSNTCPDLPIGCGPDDWFDDLLDDFMRKTR